MTKKADLAFANMDGVKKLELFTAEGTLNRIREVLWPGGDKDHEWDSDTADAVAHILIEVGYGPDEEGAGHDMDRCHAHHAHNCVDCHPMPEDAEER